MPVGTSQKETLILFNSGMDPEKIAELKGVTVSTIYSHLLQWADEGKMNEFRRLLTQEQYNLVKKIFEKDSENAFRILADEYHLPSHIIRAAQAEQRIKRTSPIA
ncbi:MAG: helix-turn-helix domain-containing protein [Muribaculaceae bacterium]|nr:helix-turn-helix domain-containing protein [Muribaculaceae bacterium]